ncbi:MAG: M48 family peptidase [Armatimonadetes bacterium]|nr:MAG: M48 family peptidase [Armatimonadota bacterium]
MDCPARAPTLTGPERQRVVEEAIAFAWEQFPLRRQPEIRWRRYPVTAGKAILSDGVVCLSSLLLTTRERIWETVLHEYAHLVVFERWGRRAKPHGNEWRAVMRQLGLEPRRTHSYECFPTRKPRRRLVYACQSCGEEIHRVRPLKRGRAYYHVGCGGRIRFLRRSE